MITIEQFCALADLAAEELPPEFFEKLNGGVVVLPSSKLHSESRPEAPMYVMGEYTSSRMMGKQILLYYGSFMQVHGHLDEQQLAPLVRKTLFHEFTHHLEMLSGLNSLEVRDAQKLTEYRRRFEE